MTKPRGVMNALALSLLAGLLAACGGGTERPRVVVAAASDLRFAFEEMEAPFEARCECDLVFTFGSSGLLSTQISQGWDVDVFASADTAYVDSLDEQGLLLDGTAQLYAIGRIVIAVPASSPLEASSLGDLVRPEFKAIAIANPEHAPYGRAAKEALESAGVWHTVQGRLVLGENASLATQFVETRNVEAGIVPLSLAVQRESLLRYSLIDDSQHEPLRQVVAVMRSSAQPGLAIAFLEFVNGANGRELMRRFGFLLPGETVE
jgi:molybdate transport system substrate-binding protein